MFGFGVPEHPELPIVSFICAAIILLPVSSHWKARNVATLSMIAWLFVINVIRFVDTLVWANNVEVRMRVWCDITTKITIGVTIALPAAALCICRYLEAVASVRWARQTDAQKRHRMYFELFMCFGLPLIVMALHYTTQGHRYDLYEHFGCSPATVITWVALVVLYLPPLILSLIAFVYAGLAIRHFYKRRIDFQKHLATSNSGITASRYIRLMALALTEMIFDTAINVWVLTINITLWRGLVPYTSWADIHYNFSRIQPYPEIEIPTEFWRNTVATWYVIPIATVLFWSFFAFGQESMAEYRSWGRWFQKNILRKKNVGSSSGYGSGNSKTGSAAQRAMKMVALGNSGTSSSSPSTDASAPQTKSNGFAFNLIPFLRKSNGKSGGNTSTAVSSRPKPPRQGHVKDGLSISLGDDDSFMSGDDHDGKDMEKPLPLSPISPITPVHGNVLPYSEPELDTSVFDTISHLSTAPTTHGVPTIVEPTRSASPEIQQIDRRPSDASATLGPYHPSLHGVSSYSPMAPAFSHSFVPRPITPTNLLSQGVRVEVETDVV